MRNPLLPWPKKREPSKSVRSPSRSVQLAKIIHVRVQNGAAPLENGRAVRDAEGPQSVWSLAEIGLKISGQDHSLTAVKH
jgi:hypothetical protein